ncbi:MAG: imidazole glycerol phosphate synthase subunit HisH [Candidatus Nanopelagicaceae bacterium]
MIAILDYGSGNLKSALRAFETTGRKVLLTSDPEIALSAAGLVVPGVGAFAACMNGLLKVQGDQIIKNRIAKGLPTLGICVGMQILFTKGTENQGANGVNAIAGKVEKLSAPVLPHMGWNTVKVFGESRLFKGVEDESFYFVHSYAVKSAELKVGATSNYHGEFLAALEVGPLAATQFHPEKSGAAGLKLIQNWVEGL